MSGPALYNATLLARDDLSETLAMFRVRPDEPPPDGAAWFEPGQYVSLGLNMDEPGGSTAVLRPYSIASEPDERGFLEFYVRRTSNPESDTPFTHLLWPMRPGGRLHAGSKFVGRFTYAHTVGPEDPRLRVFVAAGTGLAPFMSMLRNRKRHGTEAELSRLAVLHGASRPHELGYRVELEAALNRTATRYLPTISRPHLAPGWTGETGRVETFFEGEKLERLERHLGLPEGGLAPDRATVYVCGFTETIAQTVVRLVRRGFVPDSPRLRRMVGIPPELPASLFFEQYDTAPLIDPKDAALIERLREDFKLAIRLDS